MKHYAEPRYYTNKVLEILSICDTVTPVTLSLLNYLSDEEVYDWAISNGYLIDDDETEN